jgi:hypothetical protein
MLRRETVSDFNMVLRAILIITLSCMALATALAVLDACLHVPLAEYLAKKFCDASINGVIAITGLVAGKGLNNQKRQ